MVKGVKKNTRLGPELATRIYKVLLSTKHMESVIWIKDVKWWYILSRYKTINHFLTNFSFSLLVKNIEDKDPKKPPIFWSGYSFTSFLLSSFCVLFTPFYATFPAFTLFYPPYFSFPYTFFTSSSFWFISSFLSFYKSIAYISSFLYYSSSFFSSPSIFFKYLSFYSNYSIILSACFNFLYDLSNYSFFYWFCLWSYSFSLLTFYS